MRERSTSLIPSSACFTLNLIAGFVGFVPLFLAGLLWFQPFKPRFNVAQPRELRRVYASL
jgi:hypothetical protein